MEQHTLSPTALSELEDRIVNRIKAELANVTITPKQPAPYDLLTGNQVCKLLGISLVTLNTWKRNGTLPYHQFGSRIRFKYEEIMHVAKKK